MPEAAETDHIEELAGTYQARVIRSREELAGYNGTKIGLLRGIGHDILTLPDLALLLASHLRNRMHEAFDSQDKPPENHNGLLVLPGYLAPNKHLERFVAELDGKAGRDRHFDEITARKTIFDDLGPLTETIKRNDHPLTLVGHSRAGLLLLCALRVLQGEGADHLVKRMFLLSPTSYGIRDELAIVAKYIGIEAIKDLCPDSEPVRYWQDLNAANRAKVTVITSEGGDAFISPERAFVDGGTMLLTPPTGHQAQVRDPDSEFFRLAVALIKHTIANPYQQAA